MIMFFIHKYYVMYYVLLGGGAMDGSVSYVVEVGPRLSFTTAWSANAVSICKACGLNEVYRIERSRRYKLLVDGDEAPLDSSQLDQFALLVSF